MSFRVDVEDEGVTPGDWFWASLEPLLGEAVPSFESFFLDDLLGSFPRDSCKGASVRASPEVGDGRQWGDENCRVGRRGIGEE